MRQGIDDQHIKSAMVRSDLAASAEEQVGVYYDGLPKIADTA